METSSEDPQEPTDTWVLVADERHASLLVQSSVGSLHEIDSWVRAEADEDGMAYAAEIAAGINALQADFDSLVVAAPPSLLVNLSLAFGDTLNGKVAAGLARDLMQLSPKELRTQLHDAHVV